MFTSGSRQSIGYGSPRSAYGAWFVTLVGMGVSAAALGQWIVQDRALNSLQRASDAEISRLVADGIPDGRTAPYYELLGERAAGLAVPDLYSARLSVRRAVALDPRSAHAFAHLAYLESVVEDGERRAHDALRRSISLCRDCETALSLWRIEFVAADWWRMPADLRADAIDQVTRLSGDKATREAAMSLSVKATSQGIPLSPDTGL